MGLSSDKEMRQSAGLLHLNRFESDPHQKVKGEDECLLPLLGAANRTRTGTKSPSADFKSAMSTYSIIAAAIG